MWIVVVFGGERVIWIECDTATDAFNERDLRSGMGYMIEIFPPGHDPWVWKGDCQVI